YRKRLRIGGLLEVPWDLVLPGLLADQGAVLEEAADVGVVEVFAIALEGQAGLPAQGAIGELHRRAVLPGDRGGLGVIVLGLVGDRLRGLLGPPGVLRAAAIGGDDPGGVTRRHALDRGDLPVP